MATSATSPGAIGLSFCVTWDATCANVNGGDAVKEKSETNVQVPYQMVDEIRDMLKFCPPEPVAGNPEHLRGFHTLLGVFLCSTCSGRFAHRTYLPNEWTPLWDGQDEPENVPCDVCGGVA